jgi:hypothetical protein
MTNSRLYCVKDIEKEILFAKHYTNKADCHDITEILPKVVIKTTNLTH